MGDPDSPWNFRRTVHGGPGNEEVEVWLIIEGWSTPFASFAFLSPVISLVRLDPRGEHKLTVRFRFADYAQVFRIRLRVRPMVHVPMIVYVHLPRMEKGKSNDLWHGTIETRFVITRVNEISFFLRHRVCIVCAWPYKERKREIPRTQLAAAEKKIQDHSNETDNHVSSGEPAEEQRYRSIKSRVLGRGRKKRQVRRYLRGDNARDIDKKEVIIKWWLERRVSALHKVKQGGWTVVERHQTRPSCFIGARGKKEPIWREDRAEREVIYGTLRCILDQSWDDDDSRSGGWQANKSWPTVWEPLPICSLCVYGVCHQ